MATEDGLVIIVDFGLAKLIEVADLSEASTRDMGQPHTKEGHIVGTAPYMSPEQAQGLKVDARSDIFSFGSVLYEMVTGRRAFSEDTMPGLLAAIIRGEPKKVSELVPSVPLELGRVITRAMRKEKERRFQSMADMKVALQEIKEEVDSGSAVSVVQALRPAARRSGKTWWIAGAAMALALLAVIGGYMLLPQTATVVHLTNAVQATTHIAAVDFPTWSPDNQSIAYQSNRDGDADIWCSPSTAGRIGS